MGAVAQGVWHGGRTGATIGAYGGPWGAAAGAVVGAVVGGAVGWWVGSTISEAVSNANTDADSGAVATTAADVTCATCDKNPCAALAAGTPGATYRGGAHGAMAAPTNDGKDSHHTPAKDASYLHPMAGPAIQMDPADHRRTASYGSGTAARAYRARQQQLVNSGQFQAAVAMDVADLTAKFGTKYAGAIAQMEAYATCLQRHGVVR